MVNQNGLAVDPAKVKAIVDLPEPKTQKEVRRIIGMASWYKRFIPDYSTTIAPITALLRKNAKITWNYNCETAFCKLKERLITAPILSCPRYEPGYSFFVQTDASDFGLGAVLKQTDSIGKEFVVSYLSRSLDRRERIFSATEKECLAVLWAIEKLRPYL